MILIPSLYAASTPDMYRKPPIYLWAVLDRKQLLPFDYAHLTLCNLFKTQTLFRIIIIAAMATAANAVQHAEDKGNQQKNSKQQKQRR